MKKFAAFVLLLALAGCVEQEPWTRERAAAVTTRNYAGISPSKIIQAAETVSMLSGTRSQNFVYTQNGYTSHRFVAAYLIIAAVSGNYVTEARVLPDRTLQVQFYANISGQSINPAVQGGIITQPSAGATPVNQPGAYELFFARVDYLLGRRDDWVSCEDAKEKLGVGQLQAEALCISSPDKSPSGAT